MALEVIVAMPRDPGECVHMASLDRDGKVLAHSTPVSENDYTTTGLFKAPVRWRRMEPLYVPYLGLLGAAADVRTVYISGFAIHRGINRMLRQTAAFKYQALSMH